MPLPAHHVALMDGSSAVEVLIDILGYVDEVTLASSTRVCRAWRSLIWGDFLLRAKLFMLPVPTACPDECDDAKSLVYTLNPLLDWFATQSFLVQQTAGPVAAPLVGKEPFRIFSLLPNAQRAANALSDEGSTSLLNKMLLTQPRTRAVSLYLPIEWPYAQPLSILPIFEEYRVKNPNGVTLGDLLRCWLQAQCCVSKGLPVCLRLGAEGGGESYMEDLQAEYYQLLNASDMRRNIGNVQQQTRDTRRLVRDMRREILQNELRPENDIDVLKAWEHLVFQRGEEWMESSKKVQDDQMLKLNAMRRNTIFRDGFQDSDLYPAWPAPLFMPRMLARSLGLDYTFDFADGVHVNRL